MRKFIDLQYLEEEFLWENKNINGDQLFTDNEIEHLIQKASERIYSILTIAKFDELESLTIEAQNTIKVMTAIQFQCYTQNGTNYLDIMKKISIGAIQVEQMVNSNYPDVPAEIFDIGAKDGLIQDDYYYAVGDSTTEEYRDPVFSSQFKTKEYVYAIEIIKTALEEEELANDSEFVIQLLTQNKFFELVNDLAAGSLAFSTGEILNTIALIGDSLDNEVYKKLKVDELLEALQANVDTKANADDVYTKSESDTTNNNQNNQIRIANQQINALKIIVKELEQIIEEGGLSREVFVSPNGATLNNTPLKLNPNIKIVSNRSILTYEQATNYKVFIAKQNGSFSIGILASITKGNATTATIRTELIDELSNEVVDTIDKTYDFTNTTNFEQQTARLDFAITDIDGTTITERKFRVETKVVQTTATISTGVNAILITELLSTIGSGNIATTDDVVNTSDATGATLTDALNYVDEQLTTLQTSLTEVQTELDEKANSSDVYTKTQNDAFLSGKESKYVLLASYEGDDPRQLEVPGIENYDWIKFAFWSDDDSFASGDYQAITSYSHESLTLGAKTFTSYGGFALLDVIINFNVIDGFVDLRSFFPDMNIKFRVYGRNE